MNILAISPHTDDAELGAGASICRWLEEGNTVYVAALSTGSVETGATQDEFENAMKVLGVREWMLHEFDCHDFDQARQEILDFIIELGREFKPDLILGPSTANVHQDHVVVVNEIRRAFRDISILGYEMPWGDYGFVPQMYSKVRHHHVQNKWGAIGMYVSQAERFYTTRNAISSLLNLRGMQVKTDYAEAFEVMRWVI